MQQNFPFQPLQDGTVSVAMDGSSKSLTISRGVQGGSMRLVNSGTQVIHWRYEDGNAADTNDTPLLANSTEVFDLPGGVTGIRAIGTTGSTLYATPGFGS